MSSETTKERKSYSNTYKKILHNQLSSLFNHAVKFYELKNNPAKKVGNQKKSNRTKSADSCNLQKSADCLVICCYCKP